MFITQLFENTQQPNILVVYAGRFQPFHKGHHAVFNWLATKYGRDNVFIATSNKQDHLKSPFSFSEKSYFMNLTGVPGDRIVEAAQPYKPEKLLANYDPATTLLLFAVSEKDMAEDPRFKVGAKKDGSPSYFQHLPAKLTDTKTFNEHAYLVVAPKFNFTVLGQPMDSATDIRKMYPESDEKTRQAIIKDLFGRYTPEAQHIMDNKLGAPESKNVTVPKVGKMYEEAAGVGLVRGGNDPRYVMATTGDQNDVNSKTLGKMMKAYKLVGQKAPKTGQTQVKGTIAESEESVSAVERAIIRRIMNQHLDLLSQHGPAAIMDAARDVAEWVGDVDEIGSSDVSAWVKQVERSLSDTVEETAPLSLEDKLRAELQRQKELDEGWKDIVAGGALAAGMALGGGAAHAQNVDVSAQQNVPAATAQAPQSTVGMYTQGVSFPAAYTINYKGQDYKFAGRDAEAPQGGQQVTVGAGAIGIRGLKPVNVILSPDGQYYIAGTPVNEDGMEGKSLADVARVYSGKKGCMCGCRGKYSEAPRSKAIVFNKIMKDPNHEFDASANCVYLDTPSGRTLAAYFTDVIPEHIEEAGPGPVSTEQFQKALQVVQQFAYTFKQFSRDQKHVISDIEDQILGMESQWDEAMLGMLSGDVEDAMGDARNALNVALSKIYEIQAQAEYTMRSIQNAIEDAEQEANWKD